MRRARPTPLGAAVELLAEMAAVEDSAAIELGRAYRRLTDATAATNDPAVVAVVLASRAMLETVGRSAARKAMVLDRLAELAGGQCGLVGPVR